MATENITRQANSYKHGGCLGGKNSTEYVIYSDAKRRCQNPTREQYKDYGGRGIKFLFSSFGEFIEELGLRPSPLHTLDRIDNEGHYEKGNVRWATQDVQNRNQRTNVELTYKGETRILADWFKEFTVLQSRLYRGWCIPCAFENGWRVQCTHKTEKPFATNHWKKSNLYETK